MEQGLPCIRLGYTGSLLYICRLYDIKSKQIKKIVRLTCLQQPNWVMLISNMIFSIVPLRHVAPNMNKQRSRSGLYEREVIRREANETEGLVFN